ATIISWKKPALPMMPAPRLPRRDGNRFNCHAGGMALDREETGRLRKLPQQLGIAAQGHDFNLRIYSIAFSFGEGEVCSGTSMDPDQHNATQERPADEKPAPSGAAQGQNAPRHGQ